MPDRIAPALTPEQWDARDYRQPARELDEWAKAGAGQGNAGDSTEYVAKLGLDDRGCVVVMNRSHDRVLVPPPARPPLAAFALAGERFGFGPVDVRTVLRAADASQDPRTAAALRDLGDRLQALLPPSGGGS